MLFLVGQEEKLYNIGYIKLPRQWAKNMLDRAKILPFQILTILLLFHLVFNTIWILLNNAPPSWDEANHTRISYLFLHSFQEILTGTLNPKELPIALSGLSGPYGPFVRLVAGLALLLNPTVKTVQFVATGFFLMAIAAVYLLGAEVFKNKWIALLTAAIFSFHQILYDHSRWLLLDIPLTFAITLTIYFLLKSNYFENRMYSILTFLTASLVGFTKPQGLVYLIFPFSYFLFLIIKRRRWDNISNIALGSIMFFITFSLWIAPNIKDIITNYFSVAVRAEPISDPAMLLDLTTWFHYLKLYIDYEIGFFVFLFFTATLWYYLRSQLNYKWFIFVFILFYYLLFTILPNKDMRYLFPILPFTSLVFAKGITELYKQKVILGKLALAAIFSFNIIFYLSLSFGIPFEKGLRQQFFIEPIEDIVYLNLTDYPVRKFDLAVWPSEEIVNDLSKLNERPKKILVAVDNERVNTSNLVLFATKNRITKLIINTPFQFSEFPTQAVANYVEQHDYVVVADQDINPFYLFNKKALVQITNYTKEVYTSPVFAYELPTGVRILVFATGKGQANLEGY